MSEFQTLDTGTRIDFITGSRRDSDAGKPRYDLVGRHALRREADLMARGAQKYGERNWELGQPISRSFASLLRHAYQWAEGETAEDHLAAVRFNAASIIHVLEEVAAGRLPIELIDLPEIRRQFDGRPSR